VFGIFANRARPRQGQQVLMWDLLVGDYWGGAASVSHASTASPKAAP
jgi:hypothetical protein